VSRPINGLFTFHVGQGLSALVFVIEMTLGETARSGSDVRAECDVGEQQGEREKHQAGYAHQGLSNATPA